MTETEPASKIFYVYHIHTMIVVRGKSFWFRPAQHCMWCGQLRQKFIGLRATL